MGSNPPYEPIRRIGAGYLVLESLPDLLESAGFLQHSLLVQLLQHLLQAQPEIPEQANATAAMANVFTHALMILRILNMQPSFQKYCPFARST